MKKTNNKGFSLVELIIVVAIMAVLVGVLAPQYIKYLDKSKAGTDRQMLDNLRQAITTTILDPDLSDPTDHGAPSPDTDATIDTADWKAISAKDSSEKFWKEVFEIMGVADGTKLLDELNYDPGTNPEIYYYVTNKKQVYVRVMYDKTKTWNAADANIYDYEIE